MDFCASFPPNNEGKQGADNSFGTPAQKKNEVGLMTVHLMNTGSVHAYIDVQRLL